MRFIRSSWCPLSLGILALVFILDSLLDKKEPAPLVQSSSRIYSENSDWVPPPETDIPADQNGDLIRYGKELIIHTSKYFGPHGSVASITNGMNCQNCHLDAGTRSFANPFSAVASTYPKYRDRSGRLESVEFRVNECIQRSLNGEKLDSLDYEMRAMVAYLKWVGSEVPKNIHPRGIATGTLPFLNRAADPVRGKNIYTSTCQRCHGPDGKGVLDPDGTSYTYPPLWGSNSFNVSAGLFQLSRLAGFIKQNMPYDKSIPGPVLSDEDAWDVAAFISAQPRPDKRFAYDWPNIAKKPVDYPFGPFADSFSELQHKYGPFAVMVPK
jgi:thiosulfate dehydrogenase